MTFVEACGRYLVALEEQLAEERKRREEADRLLKKVHDRSCIKYDEVFDYFARRSSEGEP